MICTKCNNEIPEGAKFCPSCGAAAAAPEEKKLYCEKCGLELMKGAKFCAVCGSNGVARENKSAEVMAAVDLGKPSQSDSLVSAMNGSAAPVSTGVPMPANSVPVPSNGIPMPVDGGNSGIAAPSGSYSAPEPVAPAYVASVSAGDAQAPVMPMPTASGEAVAAVKKKGNGGKIALFSILGVLLIAAAAVLVMFFTNRAAFLSTLMGKEKYATMVEGNSIKTVTDKLDIPAISNGIKTASGTMQSFYAAYGPEMLDDMTGIKSIVPMSYTSTSDGSYTGGGFDLESFSKEFAALLIDTYGVNSISETLTVNVELDKSVKDMLKNEMDGVDLDEVLGLVNGTSLNYTLTAKDSMAAVTMGTNGKITVNAKLMLDGQDAYISLPFVSDKALKVTVPKGDSAEQFKLDAAPLELDANELERLITECVEIYLDYYKNSAIEMEDGELKAGSVSVEGKVITAEFKGKQLSKMFTDIAKHIVKDDYLMTAIADYANGLGAETTKQELIDKALDEIEDIPEADNSDKLVITTVIDRSGEVLGKSFKAINDKDVLCEIVCANTKDKFGFEIDYPDEYDTFNCKVTVDKQDDENGTCKIKLTIEEEEFSVVIGYSDCKTAEFCGNKIPTGKISVGITLPESLADEFGDKKYFDAVNSAKFNMEITADSASTISYSIGVDVPDYGNITFKDVVTAMNDESELKVPSNVIDVTNALTGNTAPGDDTYSKLEEFGNEVLEALKKALPEFIASELPSGSGNLADSDDVEYLLEDIMDDMNDINTILQNGDSSDEYRRSALEELFSDYMTLYVEVSGKKYKMTAAEFYAFENRYNNLFNECLNLGVYSSGISGNLSPLAAQVQAKMINIYDKYSDIYYNYIDGSLTIPDSAIIEVNNAYDKLNEYCASTGLNDFSECSDEQLRHIDALLDELDSKINALNVQ